MPRKRRTFTDEFKTDGSVIREGKSRADIVSE